MHRGSPPGRGLRAGVSLWGAPSTSGSFPQRVLRPWPRPLVTRSLGYASTREKHRPWSHDPPPRWHAHASRREEQDFACPRSGPYLSHCDFIYAAPMALPSVTSCTALAMYATLAELTPATEMRPSREVDVVLLCQPAHLRSHPRRRTFQLVGDMTPVVRGARPSISLRRSLRMPPMRSAIAAHSS